VLIDLIHNLALLITLVVLHEAAGAVLGRRLGAYRVVSGLLFGAMGVLIMMTPPMFAPGVHYDARSVVLALAGLFGGPLPAAIAAVAAAAFRLYLGGAGAVVGVLVIVESAAIGVGLHVLRRRDPRWTRPDRLLAAGLVVHLLMLATQLLLPGGLGWLAVREIGLPVLVGLSAAFVLAAQVFLEGERRREATRRIAFSESRYRSLYENNHAPMLLVDPADGAIADANPAAARFYGWSRGELRRLNIDDINTLPRAEVARNLELAQKDPLEPFVFQHRRADGSVRDVEVFSGSIQADGRELLYSIVHDVSRRRQAERAARRHLAMLKRTEEIASVGSWEWEVATDRVTWSDELFRIFGLEPAPEAPPFAEHQAFYLPGDHERLLAAVERCLADGTPYSLELRFRRADGEVRTSTVRGVAERDAAGRIHRLVGSLHDITERKQAEAAHRESLELLENLARQVPGVIYQFRKDPDGTLAFPYASPGMDLIFELSPEDVRVDASAVFARIHPDDLQPVNQAIDASAQTLGTFQAEFRVALPAQGTRWRWSQAEPQRLEDGVVLWHGVILDVTDRKLAELEQENLREQLVQAQKLESVGRLAGGVAHDFNNMLNVIMGHAELALGSVPADGDPLRDHLQEIITSAERSAGLTRQLLAFARKQVATPRRLDLDETVTSMLRMLGRLIGEDIELVWKPSRRPTPVFIDPAQVDQVLANLCVNARDAIGERHGVISIETGRSTFDAQYCATHRGFLPGEYVLLAVSDDGCGMDRQTLASIFEPFFTTKEQGKGTGLGLATVYGIVKQNGGFINVYSEPGQGSTFRIYLPCQPASEHEDTGLDDRAAPAVAARGTETVLIVEDEAAILDLTRSILERMGYDVLTAASPGEALAIAADHPGTIDLLITDVVMPEMNGRDLARRVHGHHPDLRPLFMSGYTSDVIAHQGVLDEGVDFLQKPFSATSLAAKVREVLDRDPRTPPGG